MKMTVTIKEDKKSKYLARGLLSFAKELIIFCEKKKWELYKMDGKGKTLVLQFKK